MATVASDHTHDCDITAHLPVSRIKKQWCRVCGSSAYDFEELKVDFLFLECFLVCLFCANGVHFCFANSNVASVRGLLFFFCIFALIKTFMI